MSCTSYSIGAYRYECGALVIGGLGLLLLALTFVRPASSFLWWLMMKRILSLPISWIRFPLHCASLHLLHSPPKTCRRAMAWALWDPRRGSCVAVIRYARQVTASSWLAATSTVV